MQGNWITSPTLRPDHNQHRRRSGFFRTIQRSNRGVRLAACALTLTLNATAAEPQTTVTSAAKSQTDFFETKIRPILAENCYKCHSVEQGKSKGGLTLDSREGWMHGGEDGPVIAPGDPVHSKLVRAISYQDADLQMPPKGKKMSDQDIAALTAWVKMGAPDPRTGISPASYKLTGLTGKARAHWAFQPLKNAVPPVVKNKGWCVTPVDSFILAKLEERNMLPTPQASRETLIRRAYYDLVGLPPTPQEVQTFVSDGTPDAYAKVIDRLLASPHYGERWGRHWLDTARYADTKGDMGGQRNADYRYPYAWTYRDYVIDAFNKDKPYNEFIVEQIAADKLPESQQDKTKLAALGFLTVGQRFPNVNDVINDRIDVVSKGFLGLTVSCARCHDHKFDPIPTTDYYALHGVFASTIEPPEKPIIRPPNAAQFVDFRQKCGVFEDTNRKIYYDAISKWLAEFHSKSKAYLLAANQRRYVKGATAEMLKAQIEAMQKDALDPKFVQVFVQRLRRDDPVFGPFKIFSDLNSSEFAVRSAPILARLGAEDALRKQKLNPLVAAAFKEATPPNAIDDVIAIYVNLFAGVESKTQAYLDTCATTHEGVIQGLDAATAEIIGAPFTVMTASEATTANLQEFAAKLPNLFDKMIPFEFTKINELELTHPGAPACAMVVADALKAQNSPVFIRGQAQVRGPIVPRHFLEILSPGGKPEPFTDGSGRLELARDIASASNPLTARVMVNRVWMHHFGEGFVRTPDNLGTQSEPPTHPELLDYLANYFIENHWSLKKLHRMIMLSRVYQEGSETTPAYEQADPEDRLLWRANIRRLDFESLRDTLLVFSGKLDPTVGGQPVNITDEPYSHRRSVYGYIDRGHLPELMSLFDFSDPDMPNSRRNSTIVPQQALFLMNSPMAVGVTRDIIERRDFAQSTTDMQRIVQLYRIIFQRVPHLPEIQLGLQFIAQEAVAQAKLDAGSKNVDFAKRTSDLKLRLEQQKNSRSNNARSPLENEGDPVERRPLTAWETYAQTLLLSNEASYVN